MVSKRVMTLLDHWKLSTEDQAALLGIAKGTLAFSFSRCAGARARTWRSSTRACLPIPGITAS